MNGDVVGTGSFAVTAASAADFGIYPGYFCILEHGLFFAALGNEIVMISHNGVDRNSVRALRFALAAGMAAVKLPACFPIGVQFGQIGFG